jgi:hypothetical protein
VYESVTILDNIQNAIEAHKNRWGCCAWRRVGAETWVEILNGRRVLSFWPFLHCHPLRFAAS